MKTEEPDKIIHDYGIILEIGSSISTAFPVNFLPYPIDEIKKAIKIALLYEKDLSMREALKSAYISLAEFIPLEDALIVFRFEKFAMEKSNKLPYKIEKPEDQLLQKKYTEIHKKIAKKMEELLSEINM